MKATSTREKTDWRIVVDNRVIDRYTLELEALSEHEHSPMPVRCIATNTDDNTAAEAWLSLERTRELLNFVCGNDVVHVDYWMQQLDDHRYADLISQPGATTSGRYILNSVELLPFGFVHDDLRPWRVEK